MTAPRGSGWWAPPPRWSEPPEVDAGRARELAAALGLPDALARLLLVRGVGRPSDAKAHLRPLLEHLHAPESMAGLPAAVERLERAIAGGETILVHGDYDVDGVSAAALYTRWIRRLGGRVEAFVPHRLRDGYDLGEAGLRRAEEVGASVLLTADCGIVAHDALERARAAGIDAVVTDHHTPGAELPPAVAVVNPSRPDCPYPEKGLCGTGVAFKVVQALAGRRGVSLESMLPDLDLVALATVADLVPLTGENRVLVRYGLRALHRTDKPGLRALMESCGLADREPASGQVGFTLAPRINAVGRLGDAADALRLLLTDDPAEARSLAEEAERTNRARQDEDRRTLDEALEQLEDSYDPERDYGVVLAAEGWHPGVIGIVASRVVERIYRPVILVALRNGRGRGSGRSIPGFHLYDAIHACGGHLARFGGHRQAAGMDLEGDRLDAFRQAFNDEARRRLEGGEPAPQLSVDMELSLADADLGFADLCRYLGPYGIGNPRPVFVGRGLRVVGDPREVGTGHLKLTLESEGITRPAIGFGLAERVAPDSVRGARVDAVFQVTANEYRGNRTAQLRLLDLRLHDGSAGAAGA